MNSPWLPLEGSVDSVLASSGNPIGALVRGEVPAIVLRGAYPPADGRRLVSRFYDRDLVPGLPRPGETIEARGDIERVDVGTSLGNIGEERELFLEEAEKTHRLFDILFEDITSPVNCLYDALTRLSPGKQAVTAYEADGRRYGPAIFRCHMPHWGYPPHVDSVRRRQARTAYDVYRFPHQLAGILMLQAPEKEATSVDSIQYGKEWNHETAKREGRDFGDDLGALDREAFHAYVQENHIDRYEVRLNEGDMYFFKSENVHEVPGFTGNRPRIVMATFIGYSPDEDEIFVWS
jgi:hypothetical protein